MCVCVCVCILLSKVLHTTVLHIGLTIYTRENENEEKKFWFEFGPIEEINSVRLYCIQYRDGRPIYFESPHKQEVHSKREEDYE
jgi:hypothetical protein